MNKFPLLIFFLWFLFSSSLSLSPLGLRALVAHIAMIYRLRSRARQLNRKINEFRARQNH